MQSFPTSAVCFKLSDYHNVITLLPAETGQRLGAKGTSPSLRPKWPQLCLRAKVLSKTKPKRKKKSRTKLAASLVARGEQEEVEEESPLQLQVHWFHHAPENVHHAPYVKKCPENFWSSGVSPVK